MRGFHKVAVSVAVLAIISAPVIAGVAPTGATTMSQEAVKAIGSKMHAGVVMKLGKRINKEGVELAQFPAPPAAGGWTVVQPTAVGAGVPGAGAAGAGAAGAGAAGAAGAAAGAAGVAAGISTTALVVGGVAAAGAVAGVAVAASSSSSSGGTIISVSP